MVGVWDTHRIPQILQYFNFAQMTIWLQHECLCAQLQEQYKDNKQSEPLKLEKLIESARYRLCQFIRTIIVWLFYIPKLRILVFWCFCIVIHIHYVLPTYKPYWYGRYVWEKLCTIITIKLIYWTAMISLSICCSSLTCWEKFDIIESYKKFDFNCYYNNSIIN